MARSAGLLLFQRDPSAPRVLLGHPGGPFWAHRDTAAWSAPKGEYQPPEDPLDAARREFREELGLAAPDGTYLPLGDARQPSGKVVTLWAVEAALDPASVTPGTFRMEWPPRSGRWRDFPEIDRVAWFPLPEARDRLVRGQRVFLDRLAALLTDNGS